MARLETRALRAETENTQLTDEYQILAKDFTKTKQKLKLSEDKMETL